MATANSAGNVPRSASTTHHAEAWPRSARDDAPKDVHSLRARSPAILGAPASGSQGASVIVYSNS